MLILLNNGVSIEEFNIDELKKYLGWLLDYSKDIETWHRFIIIAAAARYCVRMEGIHTNIVDSFEETIGPIKMGIEELQFADRISIFLFRTIKRNKTRRSFYRFYRSA